MGADSVTSCSATVFPAHVAVLLIFIGLFVVTRYRLGVGAASGESGGSRTQQESFDEHACCTANLAVRCHTLSADASKR